uniref:Testis expressed 101 n=1 Tax=Spermophilus dauricus TaxID=99837 RepID=A0A8C9PG89_SPEDA
SEKGKGYLHLIFFPVAQHLYCHKGVYMNIEDDPAQTFNWTTEKVETCDNGELCQESVLMITAGKKRTAVLATKGCFAQLMEAMTFVQHTSPPGLTAVSYSSYCEDPLCNSGWDMSLNCPSLPPLETTSMTATLHCPTCVAVGTCLSAPSLPCPNGTNRCYRGRVELSGGSIESSVEVKGCTSIIGCRLMARISSIGPMAVKEVCPHQSVYQSRKTESGATWLLVSVWCLALLLPTLLQSLIHFS